MNSSISKTDIEQKLKDTNALFEKAESEPEKEKLRERAYWLEEAIANSNPDDVLKRAFSFWQRTDGTTGLEPFETSGTQSETATQLPTEIAKTAPVIKGIHPFDVTVQAGDTLWGILYHAFQSGEGLDDQQIAVIFNRLPPVTQTHFIDTVENYIRAQVEERMRTKASSGEDATMSASFNISDVDAIEGGNVINLGSVLTDEDILLGLVEKTKETAKTKEEAVQKNGRKITDWLRYHQTAPHTEFNFEEVLYGPEAAHALSESRPDDIQDLFTKGESETELTPPEIKTINSFLPLYERKIRDRLSMSTSEYLRIRRVHVEKLLDAVPPGPEQLAPIARSAVRQAPLDVPEAEFQKRVRAAGIIRTYTFGKELRNATIRQFFRVIVESA